MMLRYARLPLSELECIYLEPSPRQVLQLMPAPGQVPHQMSVKARRLQHARHHHARYPTSLPKAASSHRHRLHQPTIPKM